MKQVRVRVSMFGWLLIRTTSTLAFLSNFSRYELGPPILSPSICVQGSLNKAMKCNLDGPEILIHVAESCAGVRVVQHNLCIVGLAVFSPTSKCFDKVPDAFAEVLKLSCDGAPRLAVDRKIDIGSPDDATAYQFIQVRKRRSDAHPALV